MSARISDSTYKHTATSSRAVRETCGGTQQQRSAYYAQESRSSLTTVQRNVFAYFYEPVDSSFTNASAWYTRSSASMIARESTDTARACLSV